MMPPLAPLAMPAQTFHTRPDDRATRPVHRSASRILWRLGAFGPALALTLSLVAGLWAWFGTGGVTGGEALAVILIALTFIWASLSASAVLIALVRLAFRPGRRCRGGGQALRVALLVPIYNENPAAVFGNVAAMRAELARGPNRHTLAFFILSDTQDAAIADAERRALADLAAQPGLPVYYRRRAANTDRKIGNLTDWITHWGADWDAMVVLDADSLMTGAAIRGLADALAADPDAGLIQSFPVLISAQTLFGRMQEFATSVYGWLLAEGLALWSQTEGNYWGHNAIIRTRAFAQSARLPRIGGKLILSHDFVEAGMLRRAGWAVRFLPRAGGSYEETPPTLIDYALRDRRWCRGNLQHLRILGARGFHPISRFHLLQGAVAYLLSPAWFALLILWSAFLPMANTAPDSYFSAANPLYPVWPVVSSIDGTWFLVLIYAMLLSPKLIAAAALTPRVSALYGHWTRFWATCLVEIALAVLYAPILMVQQTGAVISGLLGRGAGWLPQSRGAVRHRFGTVLRFHAAETALGLALVALIAAGLLSAWLAPIAASLALAPALSMLSGVPVTQAPWAALRLDSPLSLRPPRIAQRAQAERDRLRHVLAAQVAAE